MDMIFVPDEPVTSVEQDTLNAKLYASSISKAIRNTTPPFTYGVLGDWGTGKTSLLHMIEETLRDCLKRFDCRSKS